MGPFNLIQSSNALAVDRPDALPPVPVGTTVGESVERSLLSNSTKKCMPFGLNGEIIEADSRK